ncbi:uncharacterized protein LOC120179650 [Hibiscus syriacus]|uniref:uncharacterized protein LOC120179650 n=1 Tax=Hibiscus syriacus TaxID=106335 RepID=UPI001924D9B1|nr:uncharacterized protein LOC120179650 [Hibiscus syriacus]
MHEETSRRGFQRNKVFRDVEKAFHVPIRYRNWNCKITTLKVVLVILLVGSPITLLRSPASFEGNGKVTLKNQVSPNICVASRHCQFGLVKSPQSLAVRKKMQWKLVVGCSVGAALGAFLLGLLLVATFVKVKKKARMEELARREYEEEALQVSMVGHIRARTLHHLLNGSYGFFFFSFFMYDHSFCKVSSICLRNRIDSYVHYLGTEQLCFSMTC